MKNFKEFITESRDGKNRHMEHLEDELLNNGYDGMKDIVSVLDSLGKSLSSTGIGSGEMTVKWDGKPAVFAGNDPESGKFFVGTKSVFNKTPKLNFSNKDIDDNHGHAAGLVDKLKEALKYLSKIKIPSGEIWQGDIMFTASDKSTENINGKPHLIFKPNTIKYAVEKGSDLYNDIEKANIGIVWHTKYTGSELSNMSASYDVNIKKLKRTNDVWYDDASYRDVTGEATFTKAETKAYNSILKNVMSLQKQVDRRFLKILINTKESIGELYKSYVNSRIKSGEDIMGSPVGYYKGFYSYVKKWHTKKIDGVKTEKSKETKRLAMNSDLEWIEKYKSKIQQLAKFYIEVVRAKLFLITIFNRASKIKHFSNLGNGFEVTGPEGFVAFHKGGAVKLVDRMVFSKANFLYGHAGILTK